MGIAVRDEDHNGTTITIVDLGSFEASPGWPGRWAACPSSRRACPIGNVEIA